MEQVLEAIYRDGVLKPLQPLHLAEEQRVIITVNALEPEEPANAMKAWREVYADFSDEEIAEVEQIVLDRSHFMREGT